MKSFARLHPWPLWLLLSAPAFLMIGEAVSSDSGRVLHRLVHPSGETAARLLILAMMATPLTMLLRGWRGPRWLVRNRRSLGVAAFGYAALHTVFYLIDKGALAAVLEDLGRIWIWTGWLAFLIFLPLAATSCDAAVRALGPRWKPLQRWTYAAAALTLVHWAALHDWGHPAAALVHFAPLVALELYRLWRTHFRPRPERLA